MKTEKHVLMSHITHFKGEMKHATFPTHAEALAQGQSKLGHGKFWIDSFHKRGKIWIEFAPRPN